MNTINIDFEDYIEYIHFLENEIKECKECYYNSQNKDYWKITQHKTFKKWYTLINNTEFNKKMKYHPDKIKEIRSYIVCTKNYYEILNL